MKKRVFTAVLCAMLATTASFSLVGCNSNATENTSVTKNATATENTDIIENVDAIKNATATENANVAETAEKPEPVDDEAVKNTVFMQLGTSKYGISIPTSYEVGDITEVERADDLIAYYKSDNDLLDFDVYQFNKSGYPDTITKFVEQEAPNYDGTDLKTEKINGIEVASYRSIESYDGVDYNVITYAFESGEDYIEIAFWLDGENAEAKATEIINSLSTFNMKLLKLGTSNYTISVATDFKEGDITDADRADDMIAYYKSESTPLDFDVYQFNRADYPNTVTKFVEQEAQQYHGTTITTEAINGIEVASYRSVESFDGIDYNVITYAFADGDDYIEIAFWLDHDIAIYQANAIINSLTLNN